MSAELARDAATAAANFAASRNVSKESMSKEEREEAELDEAKRIERERQERRDAEIEASWTRTVLAEGTGEQAYKGAQARLHVVGRATVDKAVTGRAAERGFVSGSTFEDSRARNCPLLLLLGRGLLVPALDRCVLTMKVGERAEVTVAPEGGYGAAGSVDNPMVPGSATLTYEVELLSVDTEIELWDMSFEEKMRLAAERKQRGNTLVAGGHLLMADAEYEQALRYLVFMPHPEEGQVPLIDEALLAVHLNLAATKLRLGMEEKAIKHANDALAKQPDSTKAHYRLGQAYTQLGKTSLAEHHLERAEKCAAGDEASLAGIRKERERLKRRVEKHARDRKRAAQRMVSGGSTEGESEGKGEAETGAEGQGGTSSGRAGSSLSPLLAPVQEAAATVARALGQAAMAAASALAGRIGSLLIISSLLVCVLAVLVAIRDRGAKNGAWLSTALLASIFVTALLFFLRVAPGMWRPKDHHLQMLERDRRLKAETEAKTKRK